jgi:cytochrome b subunit of formate dehydrogenase
MLERNSLYITIIIYLIITGFIIYYKPSFLFTNNKKNKLKQFGTGNSKNKSIFPFWFILFIIGILIYFIVSTVVNKIDFRSDDY